jgi:membrane protein
MSSAAWGAADNVTHVTFRVGRLLPRPLHAATAIGLDAARGFRDHDLTRHGAALAYTALFSVAPLLLLAVALAGALYGEAATRAELAARLRELLGAQGAAAVGALLDRALPTNGGVLSSILGVTTTLIGATTLFVQLRASLDRALELTSSGPNGVRGFLRDRAAGVAMVLLTGALLLASLTVGAALRGIGSDTLRTIGVDPGVLSWVWALSSFVFVAAAFTGVLKLLPSAPVPWRNAVAGGVATALLFTGGRVLVGIYLARAGVESAYGAAGSLVAFLVWVYASAQILLFGAELTRALSRRWPGARCAGAPR